MTTAPGTGRAEIIHEISCDRILGEADLERRVCRCGLCPRHRRGEDDGERGDGDDRK
jgi:hypothetical protein